MWTPCSSPLDSAYLKLLFTAMRKQGPHSSWQSKPQTKSCLWLAGSSSSEDVERNKLGHSCSLQCLQCFTRPRETVNCRILTSTLNHIKWSKWSSVWHCVSCPHHGHGVASLTVLTRHLWVTWDTGATMARSCTGWRKAGLLLKWVFFFF